MRYGAAGRHIPMLLASTFLVASWDAAVMRVAAQDQPPPAAASDANAQAITLDTISVQGDSGRTEGYLAPSTSVATKTNTLLINIPQSITVVTKDFIRDQGFSSLTDVTRYVPGVAIHQGEGNRDELVIRGVNSSANFFSQRLSRSLTFNVFAIYTTPRASRDSGRNERPDIRPWRGRRTSQPHA